ncbi:MAG TPA: hypothetical protein VF815_23485 [Myxococcaceae bacterium]|jgi:uncharacterized membrane protein
MTLYLIARWLHISAGMVAFAALWLPLIGRKGGPLHRRAGWVYVGAMIVSALTGMVISGWRFFTQQGNPAPALFLMYVGVLSAASAIMGVRVIRTKARRGALRHPLDLGVAGLLLLMALVTGGYGLSVGASLLYGFAPVGLAVGGGQLYFWLRPPQERMAWWFEHMGAMIGSGIGTLTAMLVVNARHFGGSGFLLALFLGPTLVGLVGLKLWERYYRQRFTAKSPAAQAA